MKYTIRALRQLLAGVETAPWDEHIRGMLRAWEGAYKLGSEETLKALLTSWVQDSAINPHLYVYTGDASKVHALFTKAKAALATDRAKCATSYGNSAVCHGKGMEHGGVRYGIGRIPLEQ